MTCSLPVGLQLYIMTCSLLVGLLLNMMPCSLLVGLLLNMLTCNLLSMSSWNLVMFECVSFFCTNNLREVFKFYQKKSKLFVCLLFVFVCLSTSFRIHRWSSLHDRSTCTIIQMIRMTRWQSLRQPLPILLNMYLVLIQHMPAIDLWQYSEIDAHTRISCNVTSKTDSTLTGFSFFDILIFFLKFNSSLWM